MPQVLCDDFCSQANARTWRQYHLPRVGLYDSRTSPPHHRFHTHRYPRIRHSEDVSLVAASLKLKSQVDSPMQDCGFQSIDGRYLLPILLHISPRCALARQHRTYSTQTWFSAALGLTRHHVFKKGNALLPGLARRIPAKHLIDWWRIPLRTGLSRDRPPQPPHPLLDLPHIRRRKTKPQRARIRVRRIKRCPRHEGHELLNRLLRKLSRI
jgi:hypothetical protein